MRTISEAAVLEVLEEGNGAKRIIPVSGGEFVKLSILWGILRVDRCDELGNILAPDKRGRGGDAPATLSS